METRLIVNEFIKFNEKDNVNICLSEEKEKHTVIIKHDLLFL